MKFENTNVSNFEGAFRGMRNPKNSWDKSDSYFGLINLDYDDTMVNMISDDWVHKCHPELKYPKEYNAKGFELTELYAEKLIKNGVLTGDYEKGSYKVDETA